MPKESPTCRSSGYQYILALPNNLKRVLVLVRQKCVLLCNTKKNVYYSLFKKKGRQDGITDSNTSWQSYFCQNQETLQLLPRPCLKIHSDLKLHLDNSSLSTVSLSKGFSQNTKCSIQITLWHFNMKIHSGLSLMPNQITRVFEVLRSCIWHFLWRLCKENAPRS